MTRERAKELLPIITAFANGEMIQTRVDAEDEWEDAMNPNWQLEYRIKPKPREWWIEFEPDGSQHRALYYANPPCADRCVHVREVLE